MKSEYFKQQSSQIRGTREKQPGKSVNWDRIVYISLLSLAVLTLLYYLFDYNMVLRGEGRVYANRHAVRLPVDARVLEMYVDEGDSVSMNDSLFSFIETVQPESPQKYRDDQRRLTEKLVSVESDIKSKEVEIDNIEEQLSYYQSQKELIEKEIKLNLSSVHDLRSIEQKIMEAKAKIAVNTSELNAYYRQKAMMEKWKNNPTMGGELVSLSKVMESPSASGSPKEDPFQPKLYTAPTEGIVERVEKSNSELAIRSESILTLRRKTADIFIQVIFPRSSLKEVEEGDTMNIDFDNGVESEGTISGFFTPQISNWDAVGIAEYELNDYVVMRLKPVDAEASNIWKQNSNLGVTVSKITF